MKNLKSKTKALVLTQKGEISKNIVNMLQNCNFNAKENKIYTGYYSGSGRFTSACSAMPTIVKILTAQGFKLEKGNDAPKGGIKGEYVKLSKTAFNFILALKYFAIQNI